MKKVVFIVGESGSGKSSMINYLIANYPKEFHYIKSTVTRPPRDGEVDGVSYHFVSENEFRDRDMVQFVTFGGNLYGTELREFQVDQPVGLVAVTPEGIIDISLGLKALGLDMEYEIIFFKSTNDVLRSRGIEESRITRGNIRQHFETERLAGKYEGISTTIIDDQRNLTAEEQMERNELYKSIILL